MMVTFTIAAIYAPTTADVGVECPLQTAAAELGVGGRHHREARPRTPFAWAADCKRLAHLPEGRRPWTPIAQNSTPSIPI
jgi:hypothetical protein